MKGSEDSSGVFMFIAIVFGILLVVMVVIWLVLPIFNASANGLCWRNAADRVKAISNDVKGMNRGSTILRPLAIEGECVDEVLFLNGGQIRGDYASRFGEECLTRGQDMNIALEGHRTGSLWTATGVLAERISDCYTIRPADCESGTCSFQKNSPPLTLKPGTYCLSFAKASSTDYTVAAEEGACAGEER